MKNKIKQIRLEKPIKLDELEVASITKAIKLLDLDFIDGSLSKTTVEKLEEYQQRFIDFLNDKIDKENLYDGVLIKDGFSDVFGPQLQIVKEDCENTWIWERICPKNYFDVSNCFGSLKEYISDELREKDGYLFFMFSILAYGKEPDYFNKVKIKRKFEHVMRNRAEGYTAEAGHNFEMEYIDDKNPNLSVDDDEFYELWDEANEQWLESDIFEEQLRDGYLEAVEHFEDYIKKSPTLWEVIDKIGDRDKELKGDIEKLLKDE